MGLFGWSYPPGCESVPGDEAEYCEVCGNPVDDCVCPPCKVCGEYGNPQCYENASHGMVMTSTQEITRAANEKAWEREMNDVAPKWVWVESIIPNTEEENKAMARQPMFSVNRYNGLGDPTDYGVFLHFGDDTTIKVSDTVAGFEDFIEHLKKVGKELKEVYGD